MPSDRLDSSRSETRVLEHFDRTPNEWRATIMGEMLPHLCWTTDQPFIANPVNRAHLARFYEEVFPTLPVADKDFLKPALFNAMTLSLQATGSPYLRDWLMARTTAQTLRDYRYPFIDEYMGVQAGTFAIRAISFLGRHRFEDYRQLRERALLILKAAEAELSGIAGRESQNRLLLDAMARGIPVRRYTANMPLYQFGYGVRQNRLWRGYTAQTSHVGTLVAANKHLANEVLGTYGFPVPAQRLVTNLDDAMKAARQIGYPVVVKPSSTDHGMAVSTHIANDADLTAAYRLAEPHGTTVVERHIAGHDYRLTVVNGRCISVLRRDPAQVEGNGIDHIATLISTANGRRLLDDAHRNYPIPQADDPLVSATLETQGLTAISVPEPGRIVLLRTNANVSTGGSYRTVTSETHPENLRLAERIAICVGLDHAGIDFITPDIGKAWHEIDCGICEVNSTPGIVVTPHFDALLDHLVAAGNRGRIPIVVMIGDGPDADAAFDRIKDLIISAGLVAGSVRRGAAWIGSTPVSDGRRSDNDLFELLVADSTVEFVLMQLEPYALLEKGLKAPYMDVVAYFVGDELIEQITQSRISVASQGLASMTRPTTDDLIGVIRKRYLPG